MRISDWSSDVCSSDLYRDQDVPDPRARQQAGEGDAVVEIDLIGIDRERETRRRRQREAEAVVLRLLRLEWLRTERLRDRRVGLHDLGEHRDIRSEEHTSELQSLMRISYAVFCLTKKKTIQPCTKISQSEKTKNFITK